jgi:IS1 family transposase
MPLLSEHSDCQEWPHSQPKRHRAVGKESGQTSHIERTNNTLQQRLSRLVRKTLSFSKKQANHDGAIWYYIHYHNATITARRALITIDTGLPPGN